MMNIALIDDDEDDRALFVKLLSRFQITVKTYKSSSDFGINANPGDFDFIFIDYTVNGGAGADAIMEALTRKSMVKIVFISHESFHYQDKYVDNPRIHGLIDKANPNQLIEWIKDRIHERTKNPQH